MGPKKRKTAQANAPVVHPPQPNSLDWMRDGLQCPVCLEDMKDPPIYSCENPRATPCARSVMKPLLGKRSHVLSAESHWRKEEISAWKASSTTCQIELPCCANNHREHSAWYTQIGILQHPHPSSL